MLQVTFNKYKGFHIPSNAPGSNTYKPNRPRIVTSGFDLLRWGQTDEDYDGFRDDEQTQYGNDEFDDKGYEPEEEGMDASVVESFGGSTKRDSSGSAGINGVDNALTTDGVTTATTAESGFTNSEGKSLISSYSSGGGISLANGSSNSNTNGDSQVGKLKKKLSKDERKKLKKEKKEQRRELVKNKKLEQENEVLAAVGSDDDYDEDGSSSSSNGGFMDHLARLPHHPHHIHHHSYKCHKRKKSLSNNKPQISNNGLVECITADGSTKSQKLNQLKSLYLTLINTKHNRVLDFHDITIFKEDIYNLSYDQWLNDNNLSYIYEYFEKAQLNDFIQSNDIILNSKLALRFKNSIILLKPSIAFLLLMNQDPASLKGILPPLELASFIFIPINDNDDVELAEGGSHWSLVVISILDRKAFIYDTLSDEQDDNNNREAQNLINNLNIYLKAHGKMGAGSEIKPEVVPTPQQLNGSDCGVHVLQISAILLSRLIYCQENSIIDLQLDNVWLSAVDGRIFILNSILDIVKKNKQQPTAIAA